jgi:hypoxanthine phosphoribosyltransferase
MAHYVKEVLISREEIDKMVSGLADRITKDYQGREVVMVGILKGSFIFMSDLVRKIDLPMVIDFMSVSSYYGGTKSSGVVKIVKDLDNDIEGKHVIIVEDIVDSGLTLAHLKEMLLTRNPASLAVCAAFDKPDRRKVDIAAEYTGSKIPDEFIIGYGLDYDGKFRNIPDVCILAFDGGNE